MFDFFSLENSNNLAHLCVRKIDKIREFSAVTNKKGGGEFALLKIENFPIVDIFRLTR